MGSLSSKDNSLLVEFDFIIDLDFAMYKMFRKKYYMADFVDKKFLSLKDPKEVIFRLLNRPHINPIELIIPEENTTKMYFELMDNEENYEELLTYASAYDTFGLMITFLREASSVEIKVLCKNQLESDFIKKLNPKLDTIIIPNKKNTPLEYFSVLYLKYFVNSVLYPDINGKHIFIPSAKYNMEENKDMPNARMVQFLGDTNEIHLIDLYQKIKYRYPKKESEDNDEQQDV